MKTIKNPDYFKTFMQELHDTAATVQARVLELTNTLEFLQENYNLLLDVIVNKDDKVKFLPELAKISLLTGDIFEDGDPVIQVTIAIPYLPQGQEPVGDLYEELRVNKDIKFGTEDDLWHVTNTIEEAAHTFEIYLEYAQETYEV